MSIAKENIRKYIQKGRLEKALQEARNLKLSIREKTILDLIEADFNSLKISVAEGQASDEKEKVEKAKLNKRLLYLISGGIKQKKFLYVLIAVLIFVSVTAYFLIPDIRCVFKNCNYDINVELSLNKEKSTTGIYEYGKGEEVSIYAKVNHPSYLNVFSYTPKDSILVLLKQNRELPEKWVDEKFLVGRGEVDVSHGDTTIIYVFANDKPFKEIQKTERTHQSTDEIVITDLNFKQGIIRSRGFRQKYGLDSKSLIIKTSM